MKNLLIAAILLIGSTNIFAQTSVLKPYPDEGGGTPCYLTSNITKTIDGAFRLHFETTHTSTAPENLSFYALPYSPPALPYSLHRAIESSNVLSFTNQGDKFKIVFEVVIMREREEPCPSPTELCQAFFLDRYVVTAYSNGNVSYSKTENIPFY